MSKLLNIIQQLSDGDYQAIHATLLESGAEKSAYLLKHMRENESGEGNILDELSVNNNAYYTLRSRLYEKIEEHLLEQLDSPRTDLLKKVLNINQIVYTKKRAIAVTALKKLEKDLLDYDLSNELTTIYKYLKKLHLYTPEYFHYSQLYNRHVAFMLALDKAEDILASYFKKYSEHLLSSEEIDLIGLNGLRREMENVGKLYKSHRLYVLQSCLDIFHRLFVESTENTDLETIDDSGEPIEDVLERVEKIFEQYQLDSNYYHLKIVFEYLKYAYYNNYKVFRKAEKYYEDVNENISLLMNSFGNFTYPAQFLLLKLERAIRTRKEEELQAENEVLFVDYEPELNQIPEYLIYHCYRTISDYYAGSYDLAIRRLNDLLNSLSLKKYPMAHLEVKALLSLMYCIVDDYDLFSQQMNSIQRQARNVGKEKSQYLIQFMKTLRIAIGEETGKAEKIRKSLEKYVASPKPRFSMIRYIRADDAFVDRILGNKTFV